MLQNLEIIPSAKPRGDLLHWLNSLMPETAPNGAAVPPVRKVEQCGNCMAYCLILPDMLPVRCPSLLTRVKVPAHHEFDAVGNLKIMSDALQRNGIVKPLVLSDNSEKLIKGNFQANLQMLQWFRGLHAALEEAAIEPGQGRLILEPERSSLNNSYLSGPLPEGKTQPRRWSQQQQQQQQRHLQEHVMAANDQGDAIAAAAAAVLSEARSRSASMSGTGDRHESRDQHSHSHDPNSSSRNGTLSQTNQSSSQRVAPSSATAARPSHASRPVAAPSKTAPLSSGSLRCNTRSTTGGRATPVRRGTPNRPTPAAAAKGNRTPKSPALGTSLPAGSGQRRASPAPRAPGHAITVAEAPPAVAKWRHSVPAGSAAGRGVSTPTVRPTLTVSSGAFSQAGAVPPTAACSQQQQQQQKQRLEEVEQLLRSAQLERQFYYDKLRMIESLIGTSTSRKLPGEVGGAANSDVATLRLTRSIRDILYATN